MNLYKPPHLTRRFYLTLQGFCVRSKLNLEWSSLHDLIVVLEKDWEWGNIFLPFLRRFLGHSDGPNESVLLSWFLPWLEAEADRAEAESLLQESV